MLRQPLTAVFLFRICLMKRVPSINNCRRKSSVRLLPAPPNPPRIVDTLLFSSALATGNKATWIPLCMQRKSLYYRNHPLFTPSISTGHNQNLAEEELFHCCCCPHVQPATVPLPQDLLVSISLHRFNNYNPIFHSLPVVYSS